MRLTFNPPASHLTDLDGRSVQILRQNLICLVDLVPHPALNIPMYYLCRVMLDVTYGYLQVSIDMDEGITAVEKRLLYVKSSVHRLQNEHTILKAIHPIL